MQYKYQTLKVANLNREITTMRLYALTRRSMSLLQKVFQKALRHPNDQYVHVSNDSLAYNRNYFINCALLQITIKNTKIYFFFNSEWTNPNVVNTHLTMHNLKTLLGRAFLIAFDGEAIVPLSKRGELLKEAASKGVTPNIYPLIYDTV